MVGASLDPASRLAIRRVVLFAAFVAAWCLLIHLLTGRPVNPVPMFNAGAGAAVAFATLRGEKLGASLGHWDEAAAFLGLAMLVGAVLPRTVP